MSASASAVEVEAMPHGGAAPRQNEMRSDAGSSAPDELDEDTRAMLVHARKFTLAELVQLRIEDAVNAAPTRAKAAESLGINVATLYRKLSEYRAANAWAAGDA